MLKHTLSVFFLALMTSLAATAKTPIYSKEAPAPIGIYSQAIEQDGFVYVSGMIAIDPKTQELVQGDFNAQLVQALNNLKAVATAANGDLSDIVKLTVFLTDMNDYAQLNEFLSKHLEKPYPARSVIGVKGLPKGAAVEIEAVMNISHRK